MNVRQLKVTVSTLSGDNFISHGKCLSFFPLPMAIPCIIVPEMWQCCNKIYALPLQILFLCKYINILPNTKHSIPDVFVFHSQCFHRQVKPRLQWVQAHFNTKVRNLPFNVTDLRTNFVGFFSRKTYLPSGTMKTSMLPR